MASGRSRQQALAPGAAGQMMVSAAVTKIGAQVDGGDVSRRDSVRFAGKALFLAADGEAGAHGVGFLAGGGMAFRQPPKVAPSHVEIQSAVALLLPREAS